jgi:hypothetical protein
MKSFKTLLVMAFIALLNCFHAYGYDSTAAVSYANEWDNAQLAGPSGYNVDTIHDNQQYYYFSYTNDCANFVSQCLIAGGLTSLSDYALKNDHNYAGLQFTEDDSDGEFKTITDVSYAPPIGALQDYLINYYHAGFVYGFANDSIVAGDVFILPRASTENHAMLITGRVGQAIKYDSHTNDADNVVWNKQLKDYSYSSYRYQFFHIYPTVPYVKSVTIKQGDTQIYNAFWNGDEGSDKTLSPAAPDDRNPGRVDRNANLNLTFTVVFNESVKNVNVWVNDQNNQAITCAGDTKDNAPDGYGSNEGLGTNGLTWTGTLPLTQIKNLQNPAVLHITASNFATSSNTKEGRAFS